jgi:hypothetical protein
MGVGGVAQQLEVLQRDRLRSIFENDETATREAAIQKLGLAVGQVNANTCFLS